MNAILKMTLNYDKRGIYPYFKNKKDIFKYFENLYDDIFHNTFKLEHIKSGETIYFVLNKIILASATYLDQKKCEVENDNIFKIGLKLTDITVFKDIKEEINNKGRKIFYIKDYKLQIEIDRILNIVYGREYY